MVDHADGRDGDAPLPGGEGPLKLDGKLALVTGASAGIGAATSKALAARGARVVLVARRAEALEGLAAEIGDGAHVYPADVSDADAVATLAAAVTHDLGTPDVIVNNAGAGRWLFIDETDPAELVQQTAVPYFAAFFVTRAFVNDLITRGSGLVVNLNTPISRLTFQGAIGYAGARWAMRGFSASLRADLAGTGVDVLEVIPGKVSSDYFKANPGAEERLPKLSRYLRTLTPEQCADAIVRGIEAGKRRELWTPVEYRLLALQAQLFPRLNERLVRRSAVQRGQRQP